MLAYLEISTWRGISLGAIHYYGKIDDGENEIPLMRKVTHAIARELTRQDGGGYKWQAGEETERWASQEALKRTAIAYFKHHYSLDSTLLIEGQSYIWQPQPVLCGPKSVKTAINRLYRHAEKCGGWEEDKETMQRVCDEWEEIIAPYRNGASEAKPTAPAP